MINRDDLIKDKINASNVDEVLQVLGDTLEQEAKEKNLLFTSVLSCIDEEPLNTKPSTDSLDNFSAVITIPMNYKDQSKGDTWEDVATNALEDTYKLDAQLAERFRKAAGECKSFEIFTPRVLTSVRKYFEAINNPVWAIIMAGEVFTDLISQAEFSSWFVSPKDGKEALLKKGLLGYLLDIPIYTDWYRPRATQVLKPGEVFFIGAPAGTLTRVKDPNKVEKAIWETEKGKTLEIGKTYNLKLNEENIVLLRKDSESIETLLRRVKNVPEDKKAPVSEEALEFMRSVRALGNSLEIEG